MDFKQEMLHCYLVGGTQDVSHDTTRFLNTVSQAMASGITAFQYREKGSSRLTSQERVSLGKRLRKLASQYQIPLIVDDDVELAKIINADGIHVGQKDQRVEQIIDAVGKQMFIGYSCNTLSQIEHANSLPIAYVGSGPVFPTNSKNDADPAIGIQQLQQLTSASQHPVVAIGGISEDNMAEVLKTDVAGISTISMILHSSNIPSTVKHIVSLTDQTKK